MGDKEFGKTVRVLREGKGITREEFCGDETELSVRQLARIEAGASTPSLDRAQFIARQLGVGLSTLTDGKKFELPRRYRELKYHVLRVPTYADESRLNIREEQLDEILTDYYDELPETEQVLVDIIQARFEVYSSGNTDFGSEVLDDYFEQVKKKQVYNINDLALIDLYLICILIENFESTLYDEEVYNWFVNNLMKQGEHLPVEDLFFLNKIYLMLSSSFVRKEEFSKLNELLNELHRLILKSQDFQKMPIYYMYRWKYSLSCLGDRHEAENFYTQSIVFAEMTNDVYLVENLKDEWEKNIIDF